MTKGAPSSGKSTWAKQEVAKDPLNWVRINNDEIRSMLNSSVYSSSYEKVVTETRNFLIREAIKRDMNIIVDNVNANKKHFDDVLKIAQQMNKDIEVSEKIFYVELDELLERDAKREGKACVGPVVVKKFFKDLGGKQFEKYQPKNKIFSKVDNNSNGIFKPLDQNESLPRAVIFDNDGTISLIHPGRSPYDASTCDQDLPHLHVIECMKLYFNAGYKILFVSGRDEKDRAPTERFYRKYFPEVTYELFMRPPGDKRQDVFIKEEIFNNHIKGKFFISAWYDDRAQIVRWAYKNGFPIFRVNDPEATF